jgi:hypothetical protein
MTKDAPTMVENRFGAGSGEAQVVIRFVEDDALNADALNAHGCVE